MYALAPDVLLHIGLAFTKLLRTSNAGDVAEFEIAFPEKLEELSLPLLVLTGAENKRFGFGVES